MTSASSKALAEFFLIPCQGLVGLVCRHLLISKQYGKCIILVVQCVRNRVHVRGFMCGYWYAGFKCSTAALFRWVVGSVQWMKDCLFRTKWTDSNVVVYILRYKASIDRTRGGLLGPVWQPEINRLPALRWPSAVIRSQRGFFGKERGGLPLSFTLYFPPHLEARSTKPLLKSFFFTAYSLYKSRECKILLDSFAGWYILVPHAFPADNLRSRGGIH